MNAKKSGSLSEFQSMWCFSCFKPSTRHDVPSEDHHKTTNKVLRHDEEDRIVRQKREKDEQIEIERAKEISLKLFEQKEEKRRLEEESKEEDKRNQVDDDDDDDEQIEIEKAKEISLKLFEQKEEKRRLEEESKEEGERNQVDDDDEHFEIEKAKETSLKQFEQDEEKRRLEESKEEGKRKQVDDDGDHQVEEDKGQIKHFKDDDVNPPSICNGCKCEIKDGCGCCLHCHKPIAVDEISRRGNFHKTCYKEQRHQQRHPNCYVCQKRFPLTEEGRKYNEHPFWKEKYCPCHDGDGTAKCCSCERLEPRGTNFVMLDDDRWLCLQCMDSSVMDTYECHDLHLEIREYFEGLFLKVEKEFPVLLVEKQMLNKAEEEEKIDYNHTVVARGICLSEVQLVTSVKERPKMGPNNTLVDKVTETQMVGGCEVTAILILYGLPRLLTGYILAHEMMHAWLRLNGYIAYEMMHARLRLNGYKNLKSELEEGLCQVLALRWLESQTFASTDADAAAASSSSRTPPPASLSKKGNDWSDFEKKLVDFFIHEIKEDDTPLYGEGFKKVHGMFLRNHNNIKDTLKDIVSASKSAPDSKC